MEPLIRRALPHDAATVAQFGARVFHDTFAATNRPEDLSAYLAQAYGEEQQRQEIEDEDVITLVCEVGEATAGFAQVRRAETPPCVLGPAPVELARFYVAHEWHGRGIAQQLMDAVHRAAMNLGGRTLWLGVWEHNARAIAFYQKCGFRTVGSHPFLLGSDLQTDLLMERGVE